MLTVKAAALHAGVSEGLIRKWIVDGMLPHFRLGAKGKRGKIIITVQDLDRLLANFKVSSTASLPSSPPEFTPPLRLKHVRVKP